MGMLLGALVVIGGMFVLWLVFVGIVVKVWGD